jgi:ArsR family transcriptional regulator, arsenate/arsenite/antimonite-responsive transcriptional repressor
MKTTIELHPITEPCCPSLVEGPISEADAEAAAAKIKAIADPVRLRLLSMLAAHGCEELCVCDFPAAVGVSQPTVSHHMKKLADAGLVRREQRGKWAFYSIIPEGFREIRNIIDFG